MGQVVEFTSNGATCTGYQAGSGSAGRGVVVIPEWWGIVDHIKDVCERFAREGFVAVAPDLYHGTITREPTEAEKLMMGLDIDRAARDISGAVGYVREHPDVEPKKVGVVGFCLGGALGLVLATLEPVDATVVFYGLPFTRTPDGTKIPGSVGLPIRENPRYEDLHGAVMGHFAERDEWWSAESGRKVFDHLRDLGKDAVFYYYPGTDHAFFNDERPEVYDPEATQLAWDRTVSFLREHLS